MKEAGYGQGYKYAHDYPEHFVEQQNLPNSIQGRQYYSPSGEGYEKQIIARLKNWWRRKVKEDQPEEGRED
jgi:putative ATPase